MVGIAVTDDIEVVPEGQTMVKIRPRKGGKFKRGVSRWPGVKGEFMSAPYAKISHHYETNT